MKKYEMLSKNVYQNALNELVDINYNGEDAQDIMEQSRDKLQELVDRATPKKVINCYDYDENGIGEYSHSKCSKCNLPFIDEWDYCPNCGQALDWNE